MSEKTSLGRLISKRRKNKGLTQAELSAKIGVSKSAVAKWETDGGIPARDNLWKISKTLGIKFTDLLCFIQGKEPEEAITSPNITEDVIAALENCGYKVLPPERPDRSSGET